MSGSKKERYKRVTACPVLVICAIVSYDDELVPVILVSKNKKVIGVMAFLRDWSHVWSGSGLLSPLPGGPWKLYWGYISHNYCFSIL